MATQTKEHDIEEGILTNTEISDDMPGKGDGKEIVSTPARDTICDDDRHNYNSLWYRFWVQVGVTSAVSAFCITMMATNSDKEGIYLPVLTGIMGYWLPAPDSSVKRTRG
jgi:hypothetical protein